MIAQHWRDEKGTTIMAEQYQAEDRVRIVVGFPWNGESTEGLLATVVPPNEGRIGDGKNVTENEEGWIRILPDEWEGKYRPISISVGDIEKVDE